MIDYELPIYIIAFLFAFTLTVLSGQLIIPYLKRRAEQPIYMDGPSWHASKSGTPTMGGLSFLISISVTLLCTMVYCHVVGRKDAILSIAVCLCYSALNALIGIIDDATKLRRKENAGLTPKAKLILQFILATAFLLFRRRFLGDDTAVSFSFGEIDVGFFYYPIAIIILLGIVNCTNLTDGVDGLASSVAFGIGLSLFYASIYSSSAISFISISLAGAMIGFLIFNVNPAKVFMGDTGSLFLGALVAAMSFELDNPLISIFSGGIYVIEGISVILQVAFFKLFKRRIFKMAPLHHHLEKSGWDENKICLSALGLTLVLSLSILLLCKR